jgi:hypothetical protein
MKTFKDLREELNEVSYPGNLGVMELVKFKRTATVKDKQALADHIKNKRHKEARELINKVTGSNLHPIVQEERKALSDS